MTTSISLLSMPESSIASLQAIRFISQWSLFSTRGEVADPTLGWNELAAGGVDVYAIPGDHFSLVMEPHVERMATVLARALEDAERRWRGEGEGE